MQLVHTVVASEDECLALLEKVKELCEIEASPAYEDAEKPAILAGRYREFKNLLGEYVHEAFMLGYQHGSKAVNPAVPT